MREETVDPADTAGPEAHVFPCPACGSDMRYSAHEDHLTCPHCGTTSPRPEHGPWETGTVEEIDYLATLAGARDGAEMEETRTVHCTSCGADVEFEPHIHAAECPFCASPIVTDTGVNRHIKPWGILPFLIEERAAREGMKKWLGSLWFAPSGLKDYARAGRPMQGIYAPYWTYDADTASDYRGERGDAYYVTQRYTDSEGKSKTRRVRKIRWRRASGRVVRFFDDILVLGSKSLPKKYTDRLAPWDLSALVTYSPSYLAGFRAEAYTIDLEEGFAEATQVMQEQIRRDVRRDIGGDEQRIHDVRTQTKDITFKHILLPVWMAAYKYRGKTYRFIVNGRTGAVQGERPYSAWKIAVAVVLALLVAAGIGYVVYLEGGVSPTLR
ncbi:MAG: primosomal protein N' (replication factor Y) - superfamily II helicase [Pseudomonadota bacterium]